MKKLLHSVLCLFLTGLFAVAFLGCTPKAKKERAMARAEEHFAAGRYDEAEIEYKNVLQLEAVNPAALGRLGTIFFEQSRILVARPFLQKASELSPTDLELKIKLGYIDLALRDFAGARAKAIAVLDKVPAHPLAPLLLAEAAPTVKDMDEARQRLRALPTAAGAPVQVALGSMDLRQNKLEDAEAALKRGLAADPKSADAHLAMGALLMVKKDFAAAGPEFQQAADLSPARSSKRVQLAQFKFQTGETAAGRELVTQMTRNTPDYLPGWMMLAQLESVEKKYDAALANVKRVLDRDNMYPEAVLLSARLRMAKGDFPQAVTELERAVSLFPASPQFLYQLSLAYVASGETRKAIEKLNQALAQSPDYADASVLLASLNMRSGDPATAINALRTVARQHPDLIQPRLMLADAYRSRNSLAEALATYDAIEKDFPGNPRTALLRGIVLMQQRKPAEARQAFNLALERAPDFGPASEQLVTLDLYEKQFGAARKRVDAMIAKQPKSADLQVLLARVFLAQKQNDQAEAALQKAIELQPEAPTAYFALVGMYLASQQQDKALDNVRKILATNPKDTKALLMEGMLYEQAKKYDSAIASYEKLLAINPNSAVALNNAAVLYSEHLNQLDRAFTLAQKARELFPHQPHMADTLGWILVKRRQLPWALGLLQESAEKLPESAEIQYHLGTVHYLLGNEDAARTALNAALQLNQPFAGLEDARKSLAVLAIDANKAGAAERAAVEAAVAARPDDPIALLRLAGIQERAGDLAKAVETCQAVLKNNPANLRAMLALVRVYTLQKEPAKAMEQAKAARKVAPDNPEVALAVGRLAYQTKDYAYAFSLLQEAARKQPDDVALMRDMGRAAYAVGRLNEAETALQQTLREDGLSSEAADIRTILELMALANNPANAKVAEPRINQILKGDPNHVPALMVAGTAAEAKPDAAAAMAIYDRVLEQFPDFTPAKRRQAILYAANAGDNKKALDFALKARVAYPDDAELAKALGMILYRQGEFPRALAALKEAAGRRASDGELAYYLGQTQYRLKDNTAAKASLQRALDLSLKADLATEARKILTELK